ncbi:DUF1127 domain-containing protein [Roseovarius indicus]|uniref:YjiS-like domain-containing protein n=1 Tax=Roseovarius indicus TaxID=540747 RepID=A0A0T5PDH1_9RHOB|nr:DUF1127 domain-containing protein [Roseovarius indicus]KRS19205.1 hypothetical protein XM52_05995 [Roseovarius indicus]QEW25830.1 hypothetical protein RIdsm_01619 [Roseovarius indicus]SFD88997.1 protein of unknown function [Roseovarius indicus]
MWSLTTNVFSLPALFGIRGSMARPAGETDTRIVAALRELSTFEDHELSDIGLCRSDLTPEGLVLAGERRKTQQAAIDREAAFSVSAVRRAN